MTVYIGEVPSDPIRDQLRTHMRTGLSAEGAADVVLAHYGDAPLAQDAHNMVHGMAYQLERQRGKRAERGVSNGSASPATRLALRDVRWRNGDGVIVTWGTAKHSDHEARAGYMELIADGYWRDADMHRRAAKILEEHGVATLADVDGWEDLIRERYDGDPPTPERSRPGQDTDPNE